MVFLKMVALGGRDVGNRIVIVAPRGKEQSERKPGFPPRRSKMTYLKLLPLICFVALATFVFCTYPLLPIDLVPLTLPDYVPENRQNLIESMTDQHRARRARSNDDKSTSLNETFLEYAAMDVARDHETDKAKMILQGIDLQKRIDSIWINPFVRSWERSAYGLWQMKLQGLNLKHPRYTGSWPRFGRLLQTWVWKGAHESDVMSKLVSTIKKPVDDFYSSQMNQPVQTGRRYRTCAVVGNSGILLNNTLGTFIDAHEAVIRLNNARVEGFEEFVGKKTTVSFVNSNIYNFCSRRPGCYCHPYGPVPIVMYTCQVQHLMDVAYCESRTNSPLLVTDPRFDALVAKLVKWYSVKHYVEETGNPIERWATYQDSFFFHYSSGLQAVMLALGICEKVDLLGFGKSPDSKHHYHTHQMRELDLHDYAAEYLFYDDLVANRTSTIPFLSEAGIVIPAVEVFR